MNFGGRIALALEESGVTWGANYAHGRRTAGTSPLGNFSVVGTRSLTSNAYDLVGADLLYDKGSILWKNEFFYSFESGEDDRIGAYTQPAYRFDDKWTGFYRFDYFDPGQGLSESIEHVLGVNYTPNNTLRLRAAYLFKQFAEPEEEVGLLQLSATLSF